MRERRVLAGEVDTPFGSDDEIVQARLLARHLRGELPAYAPFLYR